MNLLKLERILFACLTSALLTACGATNPVYTDADPQQNFTEYTTFSWTNEHPMMTSGEQIISPLTEVRVMRAVSQTLTQKGYTFVENAADADVAVSFSIGTRDKIKVQTNPAIYYGDWRWGSHYYGPMGHMGTMQPEITTKNYTEGSLAIDFFDVARRSPVWHGGVSKRLTKKDFENPSEGIQPAVEAILASFPAVVSAQ